MTPILCPYTSDLLHDDVRAHLADYDDVRWVEMTTPFSYGELFAERWDAGETFIVLEHDVVPPDGGLQTMRECSHLWCGYSYHASDPHSQAGLALGCTRIDAQLIAALPGLWDEPPTWNYCHGTFNGAAEQITNSFSHGQVAAHHHVTRPLNIDGLHLESFVSPTEGLVLCAVNDVGDIPLSAAWPLHVPREVAIEQFCKDCFTGHGAVVRVTEVDVLSGG